MVKQRGPGTGKKIRKTASGGIEGVQKTTSKGKSRIGRDGEVELDCDGDGAWNC